MNFNIKFLSVLLIFFICFSQSCKKSWDDHYGSEKEASIKDKILLEMDKIDDISDFTQAVRDNKELEELLTQNRLYTVFAPTNEAFKKIDPSIKQNPVLLNRLMLYHFINGKYKFKDIEEGKIKSFNWKNIYFSFDDKNNLLIDSSAKIINPDLLCLNGMIQIIDEPLIPFNNLYESFLYSNSYVKLADAINNYTIVLFDKDNSVPIGTTENNKIIYDSAFIYLNPFVYKGTGLLYSNIYNTTFTFIDITDEDDFFSMILPVNLNEIYQDVNKSSVLNDTINATDLSGPILTNLIFHDNYSRKGLYTYIDSVNTLREADTSKIALYSSALLQNNYVDKIDLSNGVIYQVNSFNYDLSWLISDEANLDVDQKDKEYQKFLEAYQNNLLANVTYSNNVDTVLSEVKNIKSVFYHFVDPSGAGKIIKINFQLSSFTTPDGFLADTGSAYGPKVYGTSNETYGWVGTVDEFNTRTASYAPELLSLARMRKGYWEIELPNGEYLVSVFAGDPGYTDSKHSFDLEGILLEDTDGEDNFDQYLDIRVTLTDGKLTLAKDPSGANWKINYIVIESLAEGSDSLLNYASRYGEWVNFNLTGEFYPVDYKLYLKGKNSQAGTYKIEMEGQVIAEYDFASAPSGDDDGVFDEIGTVSFNTRKKSTDLKFTFQKTHTGERRGDQFLWIREIKLVPILK